MHQKVSCFAFCFLEDFHLDGLPFPLCCNIAMDYTLLAHRRC